MLLEVGRVNEPVDDLAKLRRYTEWFEFLYRKPTRARRAWTAWWRPPPLWYWETSGKRGSFALRLRGRAGR